MVTFGGYPLQHVSQVQTVGSRVIHDRLVPSAKAFSHRSDETDGGRVITVSGQIRGDPDYILRLEELRVRADDVARALDLEDGSATISAKLGNVEATWDVEGGVDRVAFQAAFYETS
jgi:hypothetical protein